MSAMAEQEERNRTAVRGFAGRRILNIFKLVIVFDTFFPFVAPAGRIDNV
jgi:hypothetical protein